MWQGRRVDQRRAIVWTLIALAVGLALGVGAGAVLFGSDDEGSGGSGVSGGSEAIALPAQLGQFRDIAEVTASKSHGAGPEAAQQKRQADVKAATEAAYSKAFGGAAAGYRQYSDDELLRLPWVVAVRADAPGLTDGPVIDPSYLKQAKPPHDVEAVGDVSCAIIWDFTPEGQTPKPSSEHVTNCQRSGSGLTVFTGGSSFEGPDGLQAMVDLTNAAFDAVSG
jgi:hypothetical protein